MSQASSCDYLFVFDLDGVVVTGWHERCKKGIPEGWTLWTKNLKRDLGISARKFGLNYYKSDLEREVLLGEEKLSAAFQRLMWEIEEKGQFSYIDRNIHHKLVRYWFDHHRGLNMPMVRLIEALRRTGRVKTAVASNNEVFRTRRLMNIKVEGDQRLGSLFDHVFCSGDLKMMKPEEGFYRACHEVMKPSDKTSIVYLDDNEEFTPIPKFLGWEGVTFDGMKDALNHPSVQSLLSPELLAYFHTLPCPFAFGDEKDQIVGLPSDPKRVIPFAQAVSKLRQARRPEEKERCTAPVKQSSVPVIK